MSLALEAEFPPYPSAIRAARDAVAVLADQIPHQKLRDIQLLVSELVTNSVRHAALTPEDRIRLRVFRGPKLVRVEVSDPGPGFDPPPAPPVSSESGRGLSFVEQISDRWGSNNDGERTRVWFELDPNDNRPSEGEA
jgi:anti-sigma regulatory factor (Ser/Thr protein kinase)